MYIGDIYLPILSSIDKKSVSKITKEIAGINITDPKSVSICRNLQPVTLDGYLYNDGEKNDAQYAEDVEALQYRSAGYCYIKYADLDGFIEIESADAPQTSEELGVRNYSIEGKYLPATKYERVVEVETEMRENEFNIEFPPHVALPIGATNVRVKTSQDSVKLSTPTFMAGNIPIYRPFPAFYPDDVTHSTSDTPKYDKTAYKMSYNLLDAKDESISYTMVSGVDVPLGSYRVVLRIKADSTVNGDVKITVSDGTNNVVDSLHTLVGDGVWNIVKTASFSILQRGLTYTVTVSKATDDVSNIAVNYGFLLPEKRARVAFDVAAEYDVGECKVYDTVTTDTAEADWIQVYNPEHDFAGDIVVQNSMFRWVIKQTAWKDATKVYNISGSAPVEIGKLYNKAFGDDSVAIKFKEIKPNYLKFTFELDTGNATSESTSAKEIDTVEITPFNIVIDKDVIGSYKDHYTFESTPIEMIEYENGVIAGIDANSVYGLIKSVDVTSSVDGDIIETTGSESSDSYVVPFIIPCEITSYLYKQAADLVISKDNNDIERKFWKDDFSVDSSSQYTGDVSSFTWDTANKRCTIGHIAGNRRILKPITCSPAQIWAHVEIDTSVYSANNAGGISFKVGSDIYDIQRVINRETTHQIYFYLNGSLQAYTGSIPVYTPNYIKVVFTPLGFDVYFDNTKLSWFPSYGRGNSNVGKLDVDAVGISAITDSSTIHISNLTVLPTKSYADDFSTDTTERYQAVTGTVAYDDANKRMNVTTATGANGKASGRLKSYKFTEGSQIYDVTLPTGADGDFITLVTHSANGLMTDGIGVGLQSDGAGNWNLATLSGTTVTEGADSGLDDADVARIEIEKDLSGAYWYYIYDAAGTKPTTATGKLFTTLTEGYTGWYANGNSKTYAIENISIRAESIVGRTNVEVEEPFWFRDEFNEDSKGRLSGTTSVATVDTVNGELDIVSNSSYCYLPPKMSDLNMSFTISSDWATSVNIWREVCFSNATKEYPSGYSGASFKAYILKFTSPGGFVRVSLYRKNETPLLNIKSDVIATDNAEVPFSISYDRSTHSFEITIGGVTETTSDPNETFNEGYIGFGGLNGTARYSIKNLQISGTRVYNKPIHRGAMLETYHDGTQEVVGTTFVDDCQWDRLLDYTTNANFTHNSLAGEYNLLIPNSARYAIYPKNLGKLGNGSYSFTIKTDTTTRRRFGIQLFRKEQLSSNPYEAGTGYYLQFSNDNMEITLTKIVNDERDNVPGVVRLNIDTLTPRRIRLDIDGITLKVYVDGTLRTTYTLDPTILPGFFGFGTTWDTAAEVLWSISDIQIIAASPDATNGIAACIPPIGGGARYGVEESVYNTFTTANVDKGVYLTSAKVKTTNPNADEVSLEYVNETTSTTLDNTSIVVDADYTIKTTPITIKENETDVLTVGVKNSTTCNQPATYVESLSLIPVSGNSVLYPQDLAFISGVKSSQKRKVEVK